MSPQNAKIHLWLHPHLCPQNSGCPEPQQSRCSVFATRHTGRRSKPGQTLHPFPINPLTQEHSHEGRHSAPRDPWNEKMSLVTHMPYLNWDTDTLGLQGDLAKLWGHQERGEYLTGFRLLVLGMGKYGFCAKDVVLNNSLRIHHSLPNRT